MYTKSVVRRPYQLAPRAVQNHFHGTYQFAPVRHRGGGGGGHMKIFWKLFGGVTTKLD